MQASRGKRYTYAEYREWPDDERWELIDGVPYAMAAAPSTRHQRISRELGLQIGNYTACRHKRAHLAASFAFARLWRQAV